MTHLGYPEIAATAVSLAMDALSVSVCAGICYSGAGLFRSLILGIAFGTFQFIMPLIGAAAADSVSGIMSDWAPWIAAALIVWVAVNMIWDAYKNNQCDFFDFSFKNVAVLAFATSLDALAVGFSIESAGGSALVLAVSAGLVTFSLSFLGALAGGKLGAKVGDAGQYVGGAVLIAIAVRIILASF